MFMLSSKKLLELCADTKTLNSLYHVAHKKIEYWDEKEGKLVKPTTENAYKFELFIHNFLPYCADGKFGAMKVDRTDEFAPVKNANGPADKESVADSPAQAKELLMAQHGKWIKNVDQKFEGKLTELNL